MIKILIVHGWYNSKERYTLLSKRLSRDGKINEGTGEVGKAEVKCVAVDLPGFGDNRYNGELDKIEEHHVGYIKHIIENENYDIVIAHSWGGRIAMQAVAAIKNSSNYGKAVSQPMIILLNPLYGRNTIAKKAAYVRPLVKAALYLHHKSPYFIVKWPAKLACFFSVKENRHVDEQTLIDARRADHDVAEQILYIMATTEYRGNKSDYEKEIVLIYSDKDMMIPMHCYETLIEDLAPKKHLIKGIGHMLIPEAFEDVCNIIQELINEK